jgi:diguanylate cyclase (GGDEF)-like protein
MERSRHAADFITVRFGPLQGEPSLSERLGFSRRRSGAGRGTADTGLMARALMYLFGAGASISLFSIPFTVTGGAETRVFVTAGAGYLIAALLLAGYDQLPRWTFPVFLACGTMLIEWTIYASGESGSAFAMFYFWIAIYAFYFFSRLQAVAQLLLIAVAYAAVLGFIGDPTSGPVVRWAVTTSALVVAGAMIGLLKDRVDRLMRALADASRTDSASGLLNARAFAEELSLEVERSRRLKTHLALVVGDLRPGHAAATTVDDAMEQIGPAFTGAIRRIDRAARIGPARIAVIAASSDDHSGYILAERLQRALRESEVPVARRHQMDFGVASLPAHAHDADELLAAANAALDEAKGLDRERVVTYSPPPPRRRVAV